MYRRYESDEIPDARVLARFGGQEKEIRTDEEGYFDLDCALRELRDLGPGMWHSIDLELLEPHVEELPRATGEFVCPTGEASFAVVSDVDDTIIKTAATDLLRMAWIVSLGNARTRLPFPGVAAFYRALLGEGRRGAFLREPL